MAIRESRKWITTSPPLRLPAFVSKCFTRSVFYVRLLRHWYIFHFRIFFPLKLDAKKNYFSVNQKNASRAIENVRCDGVWLMDSKQLREKIFDINHSKKSAFRIFALKRLPRELQIKYRFPCRNLFSFTKMFVCLEFIVQKRN